MLDEGMLPHAGFSPVLTGQPSKHLPASACRPAHRGLPVHARALVSGSKRAGHQTS